MIDPARSTLKLWVPQWATVLAIKAGEPVTGPSLNSGTWQGPCIGCVHGPASACTAASKQHTVLPTLALSALPCPCHPLSCAAFTAAWVLLFPGSQGLAEHFVVFWAAPVASGVFAAWAYLGWKQWAAQRQQQAARAKAD